MTNQSNIVLVPDLSATELVTWVEQEFVRAGLELTFIEENFYTWDHTAYHVKQGEEPRSIVVRGERYEALTWEPGVNRSIAEVREYFAALGADGNTAAFLVWVVENKPSGFFISIPCDDALLCHEPDSSEIYIPGYIQIGGSVRDLTQASIRKNLLGGLTFVAFRKLPR